MGTLAAAPSAAHAYRTLADVEGESEQIVWSSTPTVGLGAVADFPPRLRELAAVELEHAAAVWNGVGCADRVLRVSRVEGPVDISIRHVADWAGAGFDPDAAATTDLVLESDPDHGVTIVEAVISLNGTMTWLAPEQRPTSGSRDLRAVLVHELGHAIGLAHSCEIGVPGIECGPEQEGTVMHPVYELGSRSVLAADDISGVCELYGDAAPARTSCGNTEECMEAEICQAGVCVEDAAYGARCERRSDCATTYCVEDAASPAAGVCTHLCGDDLECPSGASCVPLEGTDLDVCGPLGSAPTCDAARGRSAAPPLPLGALGVFGLAALLGLRRRSAK